MTTEYAQSTSLLVYGFLSEAMREKELPTRTEIADKLSIPLKKVNATFYYLKKLGKIDDSIFNATKDYWMRWRDTVKNLEPLIYSDFFENE
jgi:hypothetical protein